MPTTETPQQTAGQIECSSTEGERARLRGLVAVERLYAAVRRKFDEPMTPAECERHRIMFRLLGSFHDLDNGFEPFRDSDRYMAAVYTPLARIAEEILALLDTFSELTGSDLASYARRSRASQWATKDQLLRMAINIYLKECSASPRPSEKKIKADIAPILGWEPSQRRFRRALRDLEEPK